MNKKILLTLSILITPLLASCNNHNDTRKVLTIYNCEDYIDESLIENFEEEYNVKVEYRTYDTNETLYNQLTIQNEGTYDLVCPSEYMIQRMVNEDLLEVMDHSKLDIYNKYASTEIVNKLNSMKTTKVDENNNPLTLGNFAAGYMWGTMGLIYDPDVLIDENDIKNWDILWDKNYYKTASIKNSMRDTYVVGIMHAYKEDLLQAKKDYEDNKITTKQYNDIIQTIFDKHSDEDIEKVRNQLVELKKNIYGFEVDSGKNDIITGKIKMNLAWSGDAVYSIDTALKEGNNGQGKVLKYQVPEEGSNIWYDGWVMPKGANKELAYKFINYISDPANAAINMEYIGYTTFISSNEVFDHVANLHGASEFYSGDTYHPDNEEEEEEISASIVLYQNKFYKCIKECSNILPTNDEYFTLLNEDEAPSLEGYDLSSYFEKNLPEGKSAIIYPFEELQNRLETQYPSQEIVNRCAIMNDFGEDNSKVIIMWSKVKASTDMLPYYIILILVILFIPSFLLIKHLKEKHDIKIYTSTKN